MDAQRTALTHPSRIFVAGATGFIGAGVTYALLAAGMHVTALIPPEGRFPLGDPDVWPGGALKIVEADPWNRGSLAGRSRGHAAVIHLIGSLHQDPTRGLTYHHLNADSLQNIARMALSDGVRHVIFLSAAGAPWLPRGYVRSKREAEAYLQRSGCAWTIVRAPLTYPRRALHNPLLIAASIIGVLPLIGRPIAHWAPLPVDTLSRGIAQLALADGPRGTIVYGTQLRSLSRQLPRPVQTQNTGQDVSNPFVDEDVPFGWLP